MKYYSQAAVERTMKVHEVIMRAMARKITWAEIVGISCRANETLERTVGRTWL